MSGNTFGSIFKVTTFGESHGPALGVIIDGVPAGISLDVTDIQKNLTAANPVRAYLPPSVTKLMPWRYFQEYLKVSPPVHLLHC